MNIEYRIEQEKYPMYSLGGWKEKDLDWIFIDQCGHEHKWNNHIITNTKYIDAITESAKDVFVEENND